MSSGVFTFPTPRIQSLPSHNHKLNPQNEMGHFSSAIVLSFLKFTGLVFIFFSVYLQNIYQNLAAEQTHHCVPSLKRWITKWAKWETAQTVEQNGGNPSSETGTSEKNPLEDWPFLSVDSSLRELENIFIKNLKLIFIFLFLNFGKS